MSTKTVLVADDNHDNRYIIGQMLEVNGFKVIYARNGREAIEQVSAQRPSLVFMDLSMPEVDGWTATRTIKAEPAIAHTPIIAVTGHVTPADIQHASSVGCSDVLTKPFEYDDLIRKVRKLI
ncbi:response regulator [Chloroflexia bacterium SDU3-3]|nr:response regulator [Chloroflexia bacterium SDU3-3]